MHHYLFTIAIGAVITLMAMFNSVLGAETGQLFANLVIHLVGLSTVSLLIPAFERQRVRLPVPFYLYGGGVCGVFLVFSNNICFAILGASLTLSLGILGQSLGSILADNSGFLGMTRYRFDPRKLYGLATIFLGIVVMIEEWRLNAFFIVIALFTGMLVVLIMVLNTQLALRVGLLRGTRYNYLTGLATVMLIIAVRGVDWPASLAVLPGLHPIYIVGGGITGVLCVAGINFVLPHIPVIYGTLLLFVGQVVTGLAIDYFYYALLSRQKLLGALLVVAGLGINMFFDLHDRKRKNSDLSRIAADRDPKSCPLTP